MAQRISNLYRLVTFPWFYSGLQSLLGGPRGTRRFVAEVIRAAPGMVVLDVGCGQAPLLQHLPNVDYTGIDLNPNSIAAASAAYGGRGRFIVGDVSKGLAGVSASYDLIIVSALLHHLDDGNARGLFDALVPLVKPGGRIVTIDNVWLPKQNPIAKLVNSLDSGLNVRTPAEYIRLVEQVPVHVEHRIYRDLLRIPYDHFCMTLTPTVANTEKMG
jgi:SAM-dependent methyltransferase